MKLKNIGFLENNDTRFCYFVVRPGNNASLLIIYKKKSSLVFCVIHIHIDESFFSELTEK